MVTSPAFVVLTEPDLLDGLREALERRYGREYEIVCASSAESAIAHLDRLAEAGREVAIVCVAASALDSRFLPAAGRLFPSAKRAVIVPRIGPTEPSMRVPALLLHDPSAAQPVLRAMSLGVVDTYLPSPSGPRDEGFHLGITELLEDWSRDAPSDHPAAQIIGGRRQPRATQLRDILARNNIPFEFVPAESDRGRRLLPPGTATPALITYEGHVLADPGTDELAAAFGVAVLPARGVDVAIVGAGPAGMSTAVYLASEGLSTLMLEREAFGGQAGSSSLIRNYLGFPRGISGRGLASRAFAQVWAFGARAVISGAVIRLESTGIDGGGGYVLTIEDGVRVHCRSVVIATGAAYRRLPVATPSSGPASTTAPPRRRRRPWPGSTSLSSAGPTPPGRRRSTWHGTPGG
jgi:thioredoxin reductase (NADPH)